MTNNDVVYFELNNWFAGRDYPPCDPFVSWMRNDLAQRFRDDNWCKENQLCVTFEFVDMSQNYKVTALRNWVEENCPKLLESTNVKFICDLDTSEYDEDDTEYYEHFRYGSGPFLKWCEQNFGCHYYDNEEGIWYEF